LFCFVIIIIVAFILFYCFFGDRALLCLRLVLNPWFSCLSLLSARCVSPCLAFIILINLYGRYSILCVWIHSISITTHLNKLFFLETNLSIFKKKRILVILNNCSKEIILQQSMRVLRLLSKLEPFRRKGITF
jgi:hypothetical protein